MRISTTMIEQFRKHRDETYVSEAALLDSIRGVFVPTKQMAMGTAFHSILEEPGKYVRPDCYSCDGFDFPAEVVAPCLEVFDPAGVFEVKATREYLLPGEQPITVVAKVDQLVARRIVENKTKWSAFDFDYYADSYQWRYYIDVFDPAVLTYNVFCLFEPAAGGIKLQSIDQFNLYPYPYLHSDCVALLGEFVDLIHKRGLEPYFQERVAA